MSTHVPTAAASTESIGTPVREAARSALAVRRWLVLVGLGAAGPLALLGVLTDPARGRDGRAMYAIYAAHPGQLSALALHWSYACWALPALALVSLVRGRGAVLANIAAVLGFVAVASLPGFLVTDYYDSAFGQAAGVASVVSAHRIMDHTMWGVGAMYVPGYVAFLVALPLFAIAMWRARRLQWWAPVASVVAIAAYSASGASVWGAAVATVALLALTVGLARSFHRPE